MRNEDVGDPASPDLVLHHLNLCSLSAVNQKKLSIHCHYLAGWVTVKCRDGRVISKDSYSEHVDWTDKKEVKKALKDINIEFQNIPAKETSEIYLNGENVEYVIRDLVVAEKVSEIAAIKEVREFAVAQQKKMGEKKGIVMDGRDIGTVVFPKAELKIFMTADSSVRVERRFKELFEKNPNITIEEIKSNLEMRDYIDSHREISPLKKAKDSMLLDNTTLTEKQQFQKAMEWIEKKRSA